MMEVVLEGPEKVIKGKIKRVREKDKEIVLQNELLTYL